jgi:FkbM family methyltransferase
VNLSGISADTFIGRMLRQPLRLIPGDMAMPILQGRLRGKRWIARAHTHGCWLGSYEIEKQKLFESRVRPGDTVFDIGANAGFYTLLASVIVGQMGHVYAFEPLPRNIHFLSAHVRLNRIPNVTIIEAAVSDKSGQAYFDDSPGSSMGHLAPEGKMGVDTVGIDELVAENQIGLPDYIKIDVEGAELLVLSGARKTLERARPSIFLATHGPAIHRECCAFLNDLGYTVEALSGEDLDNTDELYAHSD